jgi:hypothetical protein
MSAEFVFVLVTKEGCPACTRFLTLTWELLKDKLEQDKRFIISHLEPVMFKTEHGIERSIKSSTWYNPSIMSYVTFFPSFFLIPARDWFSSSSLVLNKHNMYGVNESFAANSQYMTDIATLSRWIDESELLKVKNETLIVSKSRFNVKPKIQRTPENVL